MTSIITSIVLFVALFLSSLMIIIAFNAILSADVIDGRVRRE